MLRMGGGYFVHAHYALLYVLAFYVTNNHSNLLTWHCTFIHAGKIPRSLFTLPKLQSLSLSSNQLSGHLDAIDNPLSSLLSNVNLVDNNNGGSIPQSYTQLPSLEALYLDSNKLTGTVNLRSFWRLKNLYALSLSNNMLTVIDEEDDPLLSSLPHIKILELASCNLRKLPRTLRFLDGIETLDLSNNHIHGAIPGWLWETRTGCMSYLNLSHNMFSSLENTVLFLWHLNI